MPERFESTTEKPVEGNHLANEWYVLTHGLGKTVDVFKESAAEAWHSPGKAVGQMAVSGVVAAGVGYFLKGGGIGGILAKGIGTAAGTAFLLDGIRPWTTAVGDAWNAKSQEDLDQASNKFAVRTGHFAFDAALMTPTAIGGAYAGSRFAGGGFRIASSSVKPAEVITPSMTPVEAATTGGDLAAGEIVATEAPGVRIR